MFGIYSDLNMLKPQDVLTLLKLRCLGELDRNLTSLQGQIGLSIGEISNSLRRLERSGLVHRGKEVPAGERQQLKIAARRAFYFLVYGVPTVYYAERGATTLGIPTAASSPLFEGRESIELPLVWPHEAGQTRGESLKPLYPSAPAAAAKDGRLYELLAAVDAVRVGNSSDRKYAVDFLERKFPQA